jgi:hypothetical protein
MLLTEGMDNVDFDINYPVIVEKQKHKKIYRDTDREKPSAVIIFLHLKDVTIPFQFIVK